MSMRMAALASRAAEAAANAIIGEHDGDHVEQIIVIVKAPHPTDSDDTALATIGTPEGVLPVAVLTTLLTHVSLAAQEMGGSVRVIGLDEIGHG